jgi:hypothetical protein
LHPGDDQLAELVDVAGLGAHYHVVRAGHVLGKLVVARVQSVPGITRTLTCPVVHI